jgi:serine/threonine protein kinase
VLGYDGQVKVLDFGIAKAGAFASHTRAGILRGKIRYMAPEQLRGLSIDRRADVYASGVMLWEALTKQSLWHGVHEPEVMRRTISGQIPAPRDVAPECPPELEQICLRALALDPGDRFASAAELRAALEAFLQRRRISAPARQLAAFMARRFSADRERTRRRVQRRVSAMPDIVALRPAHVQRPGLFKRARWRPILRQLARMSPWRAMLYGGLLGGMLTFGAIHTVDRLSSSGAGLLP